MKRTAIALALISFAASASPASLDLPESKERQPANRTLTLTDDNRNLVPELRVAPGVPTTLIFSLNVDRNGTRLADAGGVLYPLLVQANTAIVTPKVELPAGAAVPLSVALADGTLLSFVLRPAGTQVDFQVTVEAHFTRSAAPESVEQLKQQIAQLQSRVDELQSNSSHAAVAHVANLVLTQEPGTASARTFEAHRVHSRAQRFSFRATAAPSDTRTRKRSRRS